MALKNAGRRIAIPILQVLQDDRAANLLHFQEVRMLVTFRSEQQRAVCWQEGGTSVEEQSP